MPKAPSSKKSKAKPKDPKASHLYTDDNPSTTLHGTGFKDRETAERTLQLISQRSLTYQFQTVNTMYHRAKHHPSMKKNQKNSDSSTSTSTVSDMQAAMSVFRTWLDITYPEAKASLRCNGGFKPLLSKDCVQNFLSVIEEEKDALSSSSAKSSDAHTFARVYADLPKGKRLGNVLVKDDEPGGMDWERARYEALDALVPQEKEGKGDWNDEELWEKVKGSGSNSDGGERKLTQLHLQMVAWAWSPVGERVLGSI